MNGSNTLVATGHLANGLAALSLTPSISMPTRKSKPPSLGGKHNPASKMMLLQAIQSRASIDDCGHPRSSEVSRARRPSKTKRALQYGDTLKKNMPPLSPGEGQPSSDQAVAAVDSYFMDHGKKTGATKTSRRTLASLRSKGGKGLPDAETFERLLNAYRAPWMNCLSTRQSEISNLFMPNWETYLREGFNILLHGVGSKRVVIENFRKRYLSNKNCIEISGFDRTVGVRQILDTLVVEFLQLGNTVKGVQKQLQTISNLFSRPGAVQSPLFILLHSIDGPVLRTAKAQSILAHLAGLPNVHMVASIDHINMPILWSQAELSKFSWLWEDCTTLAPYLIEAGFANSSVLQQLLLGNQSGDFDSLSADADANALTRLRHVMASLTQNARDIFRLLVEHQLEAIDQAQASVPIGKSGNRDIQEIGMPIEELYWRCRDAFLATNEVTLRAQLTEFKDHKLIKFAKSADGSEILRISLDKSSLEEILKNWEAFC